MGVREFEFMNKTDFFGKKSNRDLSFKEAEAIKADKYGTPFMKDNGNP